MHTRTDIACRNCGTTAPLSFCAACGQETALHPPTLGEFVHEFVGHYIALEGALWRTLHRLLLRPGRLTTEYLAGRRRRYVLPLRIFLTASFIFFLTLKLLPAIEPSVVVDTAARPGATADDIRGAAASAPASRVKAPMVVAFEVSDCDAPGEPACNGIERFLSNIGQRFNGDPRGFIGQLRTRLLGAAPYAVFLMLPVFAGIVALAYRRRHMTYGTHVVFSLHLHAFWFLALLPITLLPRSVSDVLLFVVLAYGVFALREVYRGRWWPTLLRAGFISVAYGGMLLLATFGLVLGLLALG
ncbi:MULTISPECIES: DUF3667 domain-containing protein [unclassified Rhizobacter]|uniref:DUF3667 domain-containing protein n=1 Tax=unclassified Rhizobacter TaxID=2640088 RepID=UPI0006F2ADB2|nr:MULTISPECIES: DUF3667 domain-containing protein [unclassified Rhizobacter]KQU81605.1 hypothetical protein ASC88_01640 [Rhizobacter sp. Root29]KQW12065.1 hypothetical protein ASC98_19930 [Rhizobacter sp. Root1238]KRB02880.1 hypothetical protein ASE08_15015 [Rhizobacter sp. Root16D2]